MCNNRNSSWVQLGQRSFRVDACIRDLLLTLYTEGYELVASCCGHGKYPVTILHRSSEKYMEGNIYDFCSGWGIPRKRNFYVMDDDGYFFIPEVMETNIQRFGNRGRD